LAAWILPVASIAQVQVQNDCWQGKADGGRDAKGNALWFLAGVGCGVFGAAAAYLYSPTPPMTSLMNKSSEYVACYTDEYQKKSKIKNTAYACAGWAAFVVVYAAAGGFETDDSTTD
jgi:hypothetical protein